jgi:hypothetical protein
MATMRTKKGNVTAAARAKSGMKGKGKKGKFPVFDEESAENALKLRGSGKNVKPEEVVSKVANFAKKSKSAKLKKALKKAKKGKC